MSDPQDPRDAADREAADWHVRLGERPLPAATLLEFRDWRADPNNAAAWQRIEALWRSAGALSRDPEIRDMTRDVLRQSAARPKAVRPGRLWSAAAVAGAALVLAVVLGLWLPSRQVLTTGIGEQRLVRLDDGTRVRLDTDTRLRVRYGDRERRLDLERGQALFMVERDPGRPFRVRAGDTEVTALGTTFDVRHEAGGATVTLVSGSVDVQAGPAATARWRLEPGQQLRTAVREPRPHAVDAQLETSWSEGRLIFQGTPLGEAVAEVNRYLPEPIVLEGAEARAMPVSGVFTAGDGEAFVAATTSLFGLTAEPGPGGGVRLKAPSAGG